MSLHDTHVRAITYLRLSITERCDLRCRYCRPHPAAAVAPSLDRLTDDELITTAEAATSLGIRKIRITGGEPLVHPDVTAIVARLRRLAGLEHLALTTNGQRLATLAGPLREAGLDSVNVSIDSLDADRFTRITRGGSLAKCRAGIDAALAAGLPTKLNVVVLRGVNDQEIDAFADLARDLQLSVRFIEYMPTRGDGDENLVVPSDTILDRIGRTHELIPQRTAPLAGPARVFTIEGTAGSIGVISPVSHHFCNSCNRIRVGADGLARGCLLRDQSLDLKPHLRSGDEAALAAALRDLVDRKPPRHDLAPDGRRTNDDDPTSMSRLGG